MGRGFDGLISRSLASCAVLKDRGSAGRHCGARRRSLTVSGGYCVGETPLPFPNREVKPHSADGTWPSRAWESRSPPVLPFTSRPMGGSSSFRASSPLGTFDRRSLSSIGKLDVRRGPSFQHSGRPRRGTALGPPPAWDGTRAAPGVGTAREAVKLGAPGEGRLARGAPVLPDRAPRASALPSVRRAMYRR